MAETVAADKEIEALSRAINRRKAALARLAKGERPGTLSERRLRKLLKQVQRRKRKILLDRARKAAKLAGEAPSEETKEAAQPAQAQAKK